MNQLLLINILFWVSILFGIIYILYNNYKNAYVKEGFGIEDLADVFSVIPNIFNRVSKMFSTVGDLFNYIGKIVTCYIPGIWDWFQDHLKCSIQKIQSLFDCFVYYAFEIFGKVLYFPIMLFFFFSGLTDLENAIWKNIETLDRSLYNSIGYHICHYSDSIQTKCYKCDIRKRVHAPPSPF